MSSDDSLSSGPNPPVSDLDHLAEAAHILCMDIVGYTTLSTDQQTQIIQELQQIVTDTAECKRWKYGEDFVRLLAGDGIGLVFFRDIEAPARCAFTSRPGAAEPTLFEIAHGN